MRISRAWRTNARQIEISQFSDVASPRTGALSRARMPTRSAIGRTCASTVPQSTSPKRLAFGTPSMMFSSTVIPGTKASSWWMKLRPSAFAACGVSGPVSLPSTRSVPPSG